MQEHHPFVQLARQAIETYVREGKVIDAGEPLAVGGERCAGTFVSLHDANGQLRGCIGTFVPSHSTLALEIIHNAIAAATRDPRFSPLRQRELADLNVKVDVLSTPVPVDGPADLDPRRYGVIVLASRGGHRRGLLLPDLEGVDTVEEQIRICRLKAGIGPNEPVKLQRFEVERYT